jgi:tRNA A-37 threonylcarbamoyl transferase component Bud32
MSDATNSFVPADVNATKVHTEPAAVPAFGVLRYFGDYELLAEIARGGMGVVYQARQVSLRRTVAIKMILAGQLANAQQVQRFRTEAMAAAQLDHPHIVPIYEVGEHDGQHYFAMKYIAGPSLAAYLKDHPFGLDVRQAVTWVAQLADAIQHAHGHGILHRDLKPANVLLQIEDLRLQIENAPNSLPSAIANLQSAIPLLTDFGLARQESSESANLTATGVGVGTPRYMAPEQAEARKDLTAAVDVYGLGGLLYELTTGRPAVPSEDLLEVMRQVRESEPIRPRALRRELPRDVETITLKCLAKAPTARYASAGDVRADLQRWLAGEPIVARPVGGFERAIKWVRRNPVVAGLTAATAASLVTGTLVSMSYAIAANQKALAEQQQRTRAEAALATAELNLVRSLLRPLGYNLNQLDPAELYALRELAALPDDRLKVLFLEEALRDGATALRFAQRAEWAVQAAVGASATRRAAALELAAAKQRAAGADVRVRLAACWLARELGSTDLPAAPEAFAWIRQQRGENWGTLLGYRSNQSQYASDYGYYAFPADWSNHAQRLVFWRHWRETAIQSKDAGLCARAAEELVVVLDDLSVGELPELVAPLGL